MVEAAPQEPAGASHDESVAESHAPSHILQDGRFVILPEPSFIERRRFIERSIARHGLLQQDLEQITTRKQEDEDADEEAKDDNSRTAEEGETKEDGDEEEGGESAPKVHPLLLASARLENDGINELNRAINLATLVQTGEYFSLSNIVADSALELATTEAAASAESKSSGGDKKKEGAGAEKSAASGTKEGAAAAAAAPTPAQQQKKLDMQQSQRIAAAYVLKRKYAQFRQSALQLQQQEQRLRAAIVAEHRPLNRLRQLRPYWRLVAPEHGTRAAPHAVRPTEVLAADVDVHHSSQPGRLARRVPRYATVELEAKYQVDKDIVQWNKKMKLLSASSGTGKSSKSPGKKKEHRQQQQQQQQQNDGGDVVMKDAGGVDGKTADGTAADDLEYSDQTLWTKAEPFAIADPTLGKIDADFDPSKVAMLTLEFCIEKPSTGFCAKACLEPFVSRSNNNNNNGTTDNTANATAAAADSKVLVALQHSLFCSKMFDSVRREVASDTEEVGQIRGSNNALLSAERSTIWISSQNKEQFLPPPGSMVRGDWGLRHAISVIHCHEGEVMVQMDCEYTLRIKLVEAAREGETKKQGEEAPSHKNGENGNGGTSTTDNKAAAWLLIVCRALMIHAQDIYHQHSLEQDKIRQEEEKEEEAKPAGLALKRKARQETSPRILQKCVCLGSKLLMERRVRSTVAAVAEWVESIGSSAFSTPRLLTEWVAESALDPHAQCSLSLTGSGCSWYVDVHLYGDRITVTSFPPSPSASQDGNSSSNNTAGGGGFFRKVDFHSEQELELFLKRALRRQLR